CLLPHFAAQARLNFLPDRQSAPELRLSGPRKTQPSFSPVFAAALANPALAHHDGEGSRQTCAVHRQHFAKLSLRNLSGARKHLQDGELRSPQLNRPERVVVLLGERPRRPPNAATPTRTCRQ